MLPWARKQGKNSHKKIKKKTEDEVQLKPFVSTNSGQGDNNAKKKRPREDRENKTNGQLPNAASQLSRKVTENHDHETRQAVETPPSAKKVRRGKVVAQTSPGSVFVKSVPEPPKSKNIKPKATADGGELVTSSEATMSRKQMRKDRKKLRKMERKQQKTQKQQQQQGEHTKTAPAKETSTKSNDATKILHKQRQSARKGVRVLVVGDGNFSFSHALAKKLKSQSNIEMVCTSFDTRALVVRKYGKAAQATLKALEDMNHCIVKHGVDATDLRETLRDRDGDEYEDEADEPYDRIIFNFPHTGLQRVHDNRALLRDFFASAVEMLNPGGRVEVTLKAGPPYSSWEVEEQAKPSGFGLVGLRPFNFRDYPGYRHVTTNKEAEPSNPEDVKCQVYDFMCIRRVVR
mmetsp:Transcript_17790/g.35149  ORF Transcript_17790/g.35149 Transcript_17790/m.35149 type:complete len:403 (-) Transcript_17790:221-1429(-)